MLSTGLTSTLRSRFLTESDQIVLTRKRLIFSNFLLNLFRESPVLRAEILTVKIGLILLRELHKLSAFSIGCASALCSKFPMEADQIVLIGKRLSFRNSSCLSVTPTISGSA